MTDTAALIDRFYAAFARLDGTTMAACYAPDAVFEDPAFGELRGAEIGAMWQMLCERAKDFRLSYQVLETNEQSATVLWEAHYLFSATGRQVHNRIRARLRLRDGLIIEHRDRFDFWRWSRQALGPAGWLLGWTPMLKRKVQTQARAGLAAWQAARDR